MMKKLLWLPNHAPTDEQRAELLRDFCTEIVFLRDIDPELATKLQNTPGCRVMCNKLAAQLNKLIRDNGITRIVLPVGSPLFMWEFASVLDSEIAAYFAHSERSSVDELQPDGSVKKVSVFKHIRFV